MNPWIPDEKSKRRDKLCIIAEILQISAEGALKTQIMYKANLSFAQLGEYLKFMANSNLLAKFNDSGKEVYQATAKGLDYIQRYCDLSQLMNGSETGKNGVKIPTRLLLKKN